MGFISNPARPAGQNVVDEDHFDEDKIQGGYFHGSNEEEPINHGEQRLGEQDEVRPGNGGDGAAGPQRGPRVHAVESRLAHAAQNRAGRVECDVARRTELVVDIPAEQIQEEHVGENMPEIMVEECVGHIGPPG
jgi:hypothetical protein